jgi:hypothetical protein
MRNDETQAREIRRIRRDFIRSHHPDRGGQSEFFIAGLRTFASARPPDRGPLPAVVIVKRRSWPVRVITAARRGRRPPRVR